MFCENAAQPAEEEVSDDYGDVVQNYYKRGIREELQSYSVSSIKQVNDNRTKVNIKETIEVIYEMVHSRCSKKNIVMHVTI